MKKKEANVANAATTKKETATKVAVVIKNSAPAAPVQEAPATKNALQSAINSLPAMLIATLQFICSELNGWRKSEPLYSTITLTDVIKSFGFDKKTASANVASLIEQGFLYKDEVDEKVLFVNWDMIPAKFGTVAPDLTQFKTGKPAAEKKTEAPAEQRTYRPYEKNGIHGENFELDGFKGGDPIEFELKGKKVVGEYRHLHVNKHSPEGYVVIKHNGGIFERTPNKVWKVAKKAPAKKGAKSA